MKKIEILAPAGSLEAMEAAMEAGCDAVYIGGTSFGARAFADNLSEEMLLSAIDYAHLRGKHLYLTVNTLLKERELEQRLYRYMEKYYQQGLDAAIVQDVGVLRFLHNHFPELPLHISTQMTLTAAPALEQLKDMGVTRIVTSRELSLEEVRQIRSQTDLEIESFVHGALCYSYSGQCLFSSMCGNRSGNRGRCTQPCRMEYQVTDRTGAKTPSAPYVLSPKDICTVRQIPDLIDAGIDSFKIEGRMKRPEYAALTARVYRKWTDRYLELGRSAYEKYVSNNMDEMNQDIQDLSDLYNRGGFSDGYYGQHNGKTMMTMGRPNHNGVAAVSVESVYKNSMDLKALIPLHGQDVLEIRRKGEAEYEFTLKDSVAAGQHFTSRFLPGSRISPGMTGYRTKNDHLLKEIQAKYLENRKKYPISGRFTARAGQPMELMVWRDDADQLISVCYGAEAEAAKNQPVAAQRVEQALRKTGDSMYEWSYLDIQLEGDLFLAMSALNQLRRDALTQLEQTYLAGYRRELPIDTEKADVCQKGNRKDLYQEDFRLSASVDRPEQLDPVLELPEIQRVYLSTEEGMDTGAIASLIEMAEKVKKSGRELYIRLPRIFRAGTQRLFEKKQKELCFIFESADGILIHTLEELTWLNQLGLSKKISFMAGENLYSWNQEARSYWNEHGIDSFTSSTELTVKELADLDMDRDEVILYGYIPVMISAQCVRNNTTGCQRGKIEREVVFLNERKGNRKETRSFPVTNVCAYCYNVIYHHEPVNLTDSIDELKQLGVTRARLSFTIENQEETRKILKEWQKWNKISSGSDGHFHRSVE